MEPPRPRRRQPAGVPADDPSLDPARLDAVRVALLGWFAAHGRDLPWRRTRDPWHILVSEVMLQQIQVPRAIPFYEAFLARFPTVGALAEAPLADAIRVWGDLGRYRRVVNLHRTARLVVERHGGAIPSDVGALEALPGIGPYTAGAVACFAFGRDLAFADTNIRRVLHRLFVGVDLPAPTVPEAALRRLAEEAVPPGRGWDWNQGLMDFGATRCTARAPRCGGCPLRDHCVAHPAIVAAAAEAKRRPRSEGAGTGRPMSHAGGAHRVYRGRVLAQLRDHPDAGPAAAGIPLRDLGPRLRPDFADEHVPWLRGVVASLAKDGLAVAEERPAYDAGGTGEGEPGELRVKLPA